MIKANTENTTYTINPSITYRETLENNRDFLKAFTSNNTLEQATTLIRKEKGFSNVTEADVNDALFGDGSVRGRKGLLTSINQSLSSEGNPDRPQRIEMTKTDVEGIYQDVDGNTYVKGLVTSKHTTKFVPMGLVNRIKKLISTKLNLGEWVSIKVETLEVLGDSQEG